MIDLERIVSLPSIPTVFARVSSIANDPDSSIQDLTEAVEQDQAVAARALRIANSAAFGLFSRVSSLHQACGLLGMRMVRNVVLQTTLMSHYEKLRQVSGFDIDAFWKHTFFTAVASRTLAQRAQASASFPPDDAYTAGLLHDIGKLVLIDSKPEDYIRALELSAQKVLPLWEAEAAIFGFDHAYVGAYVAGRWGFPEEIVSGIRGHHFPPINDPHEGIAVLVSLANSIAHDIEKPAEEAAAMELDPRVHSMLGIPLESFGELLDELRKRAFEPQEKR